MKKHIFIFILTFLCLFSVCITPAAASDPYAPPVFVDIVPGSYCEKSVQWAVETGLTYGTDDTHFSPDDNCTRRHVMMLLWRMMGRPSHISTNNPFPDVKHDSFENAILWGIEIGITSGYKDGTFRPEAPCSRKHIVMFLWRLKGMPEPSSMNNPFLDVKHDQFEKAILWAAEKGITTGYKNGTFGPDKICTRGQIVTFLHRASEN